MHFAETLMCGGLEIDIESAKHQLRLAKRSTENAT